MFKNLFSKKNMPIIIIVSVAVALSIVMITIGSVMLLKPWDGNSDGTNSNVSSSGSAGHSKPLDENFDATNSGDSSFGSAENSKPLDGNFDDTNSGDSSSSGSNVSSDDSTTKPNTLLNSGYYEKVEYVAMPTNLDNVTLTERELLEKYRGYTDWRIYSIRTAKDEIKPKAGCTAYYVSNKGNSQNDGLSPETPFATLADLGKIKNRLKAGDVVYLERGSIFRGQLLAEVAGVTYAAYGEGKKPTIYASPVDAAKTGVWVQTKENKNVYKYSLPIENDIGTLVFNGGEKHAIKCIIRTEDDGTTYNNTTGDKFNSFADLNEDLHFYHTTKGAAPLYLYCKDGNPAEVFDSIELCIKKHVVSIKADNIHIDNICVKYGGAHGISSGSRNGLTVTNCEIGWIGGSIQAEGMYGKNYATRYGNGIEIYGACTDFVVKNCYFYQIYDAAATFQYTISDDSDRIMKNSNISDNVMEYCNYSFEYFLSGGAPETSYIEDAYVTGNLMWYAGYGYCEQRPDKNKDAHIKAWNHTNTRKGDFKIDNNLFALAKTTLVQSNAKVASHSPTYSGNTYIQFNDRFLGNSGAVKEAVPFDSSVRNEIKSMLGDTKSKIIFVK